MDLSEMQEFVDSVSKSKVFVKLVDEVDLEPYVGYTYTDINGFGTIEITKGIYSIGNTKPFIRGFLLHELGHLNTKEVEDPAKNEYNAHMWAIGKASELGFQKVLISLKREIESWRDLSDNPYFSKYREASIMYNE